MMMWLILIALMISILFMMMTTVLTYTKNTNSEKMTPFECGFSPMFKPRIPFSLQFFLVALIFIIFDMEIILLLPVPLTMSYSKINFVSLFSMMLILMLGLLHEWNQGSLNWV